MNRYLSAGLAGIALILCCLLSGLSCYASHIVATDLLYTWDSGNTYRITLILYADCGSASALAVSYLPSASPRICVYDADAIETTLDLSITGNPSGTEVTPLICPGATTQCVDPSSPIPGVLQFTYTGEVTLPRQSHNWRFVFTGYYFSGSAGRAAAITNIESAGSTIVQLIDTLDNTGQPNSSPVFFALPTPFFCQSSNSCYSPDARDIFDSTAAHPAGDSLVFSLIPCLAGNTTDSSCTVYGAVTYIGNAWNYPSPQPVSGTTPLVVDSASQFSFDGRTGLMCAFSSTLQRAAVLYNIREYRNGVFKGACQREMTFALQPCDIGKPVGSFTSSTAGFISDTANFRICLGAGTFSMYMSPDDPVDPSAHITVTDSLLPPGATLVTLNNGTNSPQTTFTWSTSGVAAGRYTYYIIFDDDHCPYKGHRVKAFNLLVTDSLSTAAAANNDTCTGGKGSIVLNVSGGTYPYRYEWTGTSGDSVASHLAAGTYAVHVFDFYNCEKDETVSIGSVMDTLMVNPVVKNDICQGAFGFIEAPVSGGTEPYKYKWSNDSVNSRITGLLAGAYTLNATDANNCAAQFTITVGEDYCPPVIVHNVITPNGDGVNDVWVIEGIENYPANEVQLFDKWGDKVFDAHDYNNNWGGISNRGAALPDGTYFYVIRLNEVNRNGDTNTWTGAMLIKR